MRACALACLLIALAPGLATSQLNAYPRPEDPVRQDADPGLPFVVRLGSLGCDGLCPIYDIMVRIDGAYWISDTFPGAYLDYPRDVHRPAPHPTRRTSPTARDRGTMMAGLANQLTFDRVSAAMRPFEEGRCTELLSAQNHAFVRIEYPDGTRFSFYHSPGWDECSDLDSITTAIQSAFQTLIGSRTAGAGPTSVRYYSSGCYGPCPQFDFELRDSGEFWLAPRFPRPRFGGPSGRIGSEVFSGVATHVERRRVESAILAGSGQQCVETTGDGMRVGVMITYSDSTSLSFDVSPQWRNCRALQDVAEDVDDAMTPLMRAISREIAD
ncbi:hypothetical protein C7435_0408 [Maricaulis maris]|uniref:Uncharacterized protein n=2 Tax=Maricaulis maris TaxID=74318 RepID=A0A495DM10_9PROT|nr:hypothetical protein C7435_0408 [Maricaulis maris]